MAVVGMLQLCGLGLASRLQQGATAKMSRTADVLSDRERNRSRLHVSPRRSWTAFSDTNFHSSETSARTRFAITIVNVAAKRQMRLLAIC